MAKYYFRVVTEGKKKSKIVAICYQPLEDGRPAGRFSMLLSSEWGEKEILRRIKELGLFELDNSFVPQGPELEVDLSISIIRAIYHHIIDWTEDVKQDFMKNKLSMAGADTHQDLSSEKKEPRINVKETNQEMLDRLCDEAEIFLKENIKD